MRHKYITKYNPEEYEDFFEGLKKSGFVAEEYEYPNSKKNEKNSSVGAILLVSDKGRKFTAIASNMGRVITTSGYSSGRYRRTRKDSRIMYRLTDEGVQYLKELIVEERI